MLAKWCWLFWLWFTNGLLNGYIWYTNNWFLWSELARQIQHPVYSCPAWSWTVRDQAISNIRHTAPHADGDQLEEVAWYHDGTVLYCIGARESPLWKGINGCGCSDGLFLVSWSNIHFPTFSWGDTFPSWIILLRKARRSLGKTPCPLNISPKWPISDWSNNNFSGISRIFVVYCSVGSLRSVLFLNLCLFFSFTSHKICLL